MIKKRNATLAVCAVLLFCVIAAGCSGPTASPSQSAANESTKTSSAHASTSTHKVTASASVTLLPSATPTPSVTLTPTATPTPSVTLTPTATPTPSNIPATGVVTLNFYYRTDCPYCQALEPQITALQTQYAGKVSVQWIQSTGEVPTLVLLNKSGVQVGRWVDPGTTAPITAQIDSLLASG